MNNSDLLVSFFGLAGRLAKRDENHGRYLIELAERLRKLPPSTRAEIRAELARRFPGCLE